MITQQDVQHILLVVGIAVYILIALVGLRIGWDGLGNGDSNDIGCGAIGIAMVVGILLVVGYFWYIGLPVTRAQ